jgi:DNA primase large subunit
VSPRRGGLQWRPEAERAWPFSSYHARLRHSEDLHRRFVRAESILFRLRFESDDSAEREHFLSTLNLKWDSVTSQEKEAFKEQLLAVTPWLSSTWASEGFFKVPWTKVLDLVEKRKVFLRGGVAWVPMREQASLVFAEFSNRLNKELEYTARSLPRLDEDDRLLPLLSHLSLGFLAGVSSDYNSTSTSLVGEDGEAIQIRAEMVNALIKKHAPMCMRQLGQTLEERKHLKYQGRMQFGLFLKEMGVTIEQALVFWRRSFANMTDDKFTKEYKYNIRHNYGLEGKRVDYPARSCARIITQDTPGPQDNHGCPFRHYSPQNLSASLSSTYQLNSQQSSEILASVKAGHYHVACTRLFEITHKVPKGKGLDGNGESVSHPNRYFEKSWKIEHEGGGGDDLKMEDEDESAAGASLVEDDDASKPKWTKAALSSTPSSSRSIFKQEQVDSASFHSASRPYARPSGAAAGAPSSSTGTAASAAIDVDDEFDEFGDEGDVGLDLDALDQAEQAFLQRQQSSGEKPSQSPSAALGQGEGSQSQTETETEAEKSQQETAGKGNEMEVDDS